MNFQGRGGEQGKMFADNCLAALKYAGWTILSTKTELPQVGIEVDIVAETIQGTTFYFECKGSMCGDRPGSKRTDTLKKAIANGYLFSLSDQFQCCAPMILLTSHLPIQGSGLGMLQCLPRLIFFDVLSPWNHGKRLTWLANADDEALQCDLASKSLIDLIREQWGRE